MTTEGVKWVNVLSTVLVPYVWGEGCPPRYKVKTAEGGERVRNPKAGAKGNIHYY